MIEDRDTITAIATAAGEAGIAVVRISGPESMAIADMLYAGSAPPPSQRQAGTFLHGHLRGRRPPGGISPRGDADLDEVILLIYRAPHSYTREDVVEIQGHGGRTCARRILRAVLDCGARMAEPGEFTRRAFLNGRIDLLQAEAVADLVRARSDRAATAAMEQLDGHLSDAMSSLYDAGLAVAADLEATLDFDDGDLPEATLTGITDRLAGIETGLHDTLSTWEEGHLLREGALVVIAGPPNVGKSTLLNRLLGTNRAIVTDTPGTTRDSIEEQIVMDGIPLRLVDTAGLREADCHIEREGIARAESLIQRADLILYMIDASRPLDEADAEAIVAFPRMRCLIVLNKTDMAELVTAPEFPGRDCVSCSSTTGYGISTLKSSIARKLGVHAGGTPHAVISERHRHLIQNALNELNTARHALEQGGDLAAAPAAACVGSALEFLGQVTGRVYSDELLDAVFSRFCIGK